VSKNRHIARTLDTGHAQRSVSGKMFITTNIGKGMSDSHPLEADVTHPLEMEQLLRRLAEAKSVLIPLWGVFFY
jgi:hypothetical protein